MTNCIFTHEAEQDLKDIAHYTYEKWGLAQAIKYSETLDICFEKIANKQMIAKRFSLKYPDLFYVLCEKHYIFYLEGNPPIIIAILHQSMDIVKHLSHR